MIALSNNIELIGDSSHAHESQLERVEILGLELLMGRGGIDTDHLVEILDDMSFPECGDKENYLDNDEHSFSCDSIKLSHARGVRRREKKQMLPSNNDEALNQDTTTFYCIDDASFDTETIYVPLKGREQETESRIRKDDISHVSSSTWTRRTSLELAQ